MRDAILIVGAASDIACAVARALAERRYPLILAGRDRDELGRIAADLRIRYGVEVEVRTFEALDIASHADLLQPSATRPLAGLVLCHGYLPDQLLAESDSSLAAQTLAVNFNSYVSLLTHAAEYFRSRRRGFICALSSVAGDRGRQSNYTYGAAKAGLSVYLQGLRNRLTPCGVAVITVKPGFVDTAMTWGLLDARSPLVASPERVANDIVRAIERQRDVVYTPWFWRWIMLVIRAIPERVFKRMSL